MVRTPAARLRASASLAGLLLLTTCTPDSTGIQRLPFEPGSAAAKVTISPGGTSLGFIGATASLKAQLLDEEGKAATGLRFVWSTSNAGVATVGQDGRVTAIAEGSAKIFARVVNLTDSVTITVKRVASTITLDQSSLLFTELGDTVTLSASILDGGGQALPGDDLVWSAADTSVAKVTSAGLVTAVKQGTTTIKATSGAVQATVSVRIATGPADIEVQPSAITLDAIGDTLRLAAAVVDAAGDTLPGVVATFLWGNQAIADVDTITGLVTATGVGQTNVSVFGDTVRVTVPVTVTQTPAAVEVSPTGKTLVPGGKLTFTAAVEDRNGNTIPSPKLTWSSSSATVATITSAGVATAVAAGTSNIIGKAGAAADTVVLTVVDVDVDSVLVTPDSSDIDVGKKDTLSARFFDDQGTELIGPTATWASTDTEVVSVTSAGVITGVGAGTAWVRATADNGKDSTHVTVSAVSFFDIEVRYVGTTPTASVQAAFDVAEARWEEIIVGDIANISVTGVAANACGVTHPAINETVDDVIIFAEVTAIDGSGGTLGQAGPCIVRTANQLAAVGIMQFDEADLDDLLASGLLDETIVHEMAHVLTFGVGDPWENVLVGKGGADPYWPGTNALVEYAAAGGTATNKIPVANTGGEGTRDAHWREAHMGRELMTGFVNSGSNPLSAITIAAMKDMGYQVDLTKADSYTVSASLRSGPSIVFELRERPMPPPMQIDPSGRIIR